MCRLNAEDDFSISGDGLKLHFGPISPDLSYRTDYKIVHAIYTTNCVTLPYVILWVQ